MAGFRETVSIVIDVVTGNAKGELGKLSQQVGETEGAMAKVKTGASGLVSTITSSAALSAGAIGGMAIAGIGALSDLVGGYLDASATVDDFRVATKLSAEEASKWVNAAKALDLPVETLQSGFAKLSQNLGKNPDLLTKFGISAKTAKDGSIDLGGTLLTITDKMADYQDPTKQATLGTAAFGKAWQGLIPIIDNGSDKVKELADSTGQVFSQEELDRNERMQQKTKELGNAWDFVKGKVSGFVVENLAWATEDVMGKPKEASKGLSYLALAYIEAGKQAKQSAADQKKAAQDLPTDMQNAIDQVKALSLSMEIPVTLTYDAWAEWTKFQQAVMAAANRAPITATAFLLPNGSGIGGSGLSGADQVAQANALAAQMAANARRNGGQPTNVR